MATALEREKQTGIDLETLRRAHAELELRVQERTAELARVNESLRAEVEQRRRAQLDAARRQAEVAHLSRMNSMGQMATGLAHELNQPLTAVRNYAHYCKTLVESGQDVSAKLPDALERLNHAALRAGQIVQRIREFVGNRAPTRQPADVAKLISKTVDLMLPVLHRANVRVEQKVPASVSRITIDIVQIEQILVNLIQNAVEAMEATPAEKRAIMIEASQEDGYLRIDVTDFGCGIEQEDASRVFEEFFTTKTEGLGLGLAISKSIAERHGGSLTCGKDSAGNTVFSLRLLGSKGTNAK
jgi:C4-dicarboxylate-specific signal transduction histidine kinase